MLPYVIAILPPNLVNAASGQRCNLTLLFPRAHSSNGTESGETIKLPINTLAQTMQTLHGDSRTSANEGTYSLMGTIFKTRVHTNTIVANSTIGFTGDFLPGRSKLNCSWASGQRRCTSQLSKYIANTRTWCSTNIFAFNQTLPLFLSIRI